MVDQCYALFQSFFFTFFLINYSLKYHLEERKTEFFIHQRPRGKLKKFDIFNLIMIVNLSLLQLLFLYVLLLLPFVYVLIPYSVKIIGKNNCVIYVLKIFLLYFISLKVKGSHDCLKEFILPQNVLPIMMQKETIENKG